MTQSNIITIQDIPFEELSSRKVKKLHYRQIMFVQYGVPGAMGYGGKSFLLLKIGNKIKGYFCQSIDLELNTKYQNAARLHCAGFYPLINKNEKNRAIKYWIRINLGAGNSLFVRRKFIAEFEKRLQECRKIPHLYGNWVDIAYQILQESINQAKQ